MHVWIDQDCCTGAGLCVDRCPDLFVVLEDGLGYVVDGDGVVTETGLTRPVPARFEEDAIDAAEHCPGEGIYLEADASGPVADDADIDDAEFVVDPTRETQRPISAPVPDLVLVIDDWRDEAGA